MAAACGPAAPAATGPIANASQPLPPVLAAACPRAVQRFVWAHELFPWLPADAVRERRHHVRARSRLPSTPCRITWREGDRELFFVSVSYDAEGRWLETVATGAPRSPRIRPDGAHFCHRDGDGVRGACEVSDGTTTRTEMLLIYRDDRVVGMRPPDAHDLTAAFDYDGDRLVRERRIMADRSETSETAYDARGRVATVTTRDDFGRHVTRFDYDPRDHVVRVVADDDATSYRYDDAGRLVEIRYAGDVEDLGYDCGSSR